MARRRRGLPSRVRAAARATLAFLFSNVGVVVLVAGYTIAGAFMFQAIEGASEMERVSWMARERDSTVQYLWHNVTMVINPLNETQIKNRVGAVVLRYQRLVVVAARRGWDGGRSSRQWSFSNAFLYSMTVITTIGYGHLSPRTSWGKVATILYALLGMPLFLLYLSNVGSLLARWFKCVYSLLCLCRGCPGFRRRRALAINTQLEISEPESVERRVRWRRHSDSDISQHNQPLGRKPFKPRPRSRYSPDGDIPYRIRPNCKYFDDRVPEYLDTRYTTPFKHQNRKAINIRDNSHNLRYHKYHNYPPDFRDPKQKEMNDKRWRSVSEYKDLYSEKLDTLPRHRKLKNNEIEWHEMDYRQRPSAIRDNGNVPHPQIKLQACVIQSRHPEYRSWSAPQPRYRPPAPRGYSPRAPSTDSEFTYLSYDAQSITVPISVCVGIMIGYLVFGSMLFGLWEQWDLLDGAYFCFISLTSIGFGDFVPGERVYTPRIETSFVVCSLYLMLGMALVAMCFNLMQEQVIHYFAGLKRVLRRICRCECRRRPREVPADV